MPLVEGETQGSNGVHRSSSKSCGMVVGSRKCGNRMTPLMSLPRGPIQSSWKKLEGEEGEEGQEGTSFQIS
jgi:hypothetical protein